MGGEKENSIMKKTLYLSRLSFALSLAVLGSSRADTPDAFLDYVESSGSQYIDTGVTGKTGTRMVAEMEWVETPSSQTHSAERMTGTHTW